MAGYSTTPLWRKLGIGPGCRLRVENAPPDYADLVAPLPDDVTVSVRLRTNVDICHLFTRSRAELAGRLPALMGMIRPDGAIWVSWPKKASGVQTDVSENSVRSEALPLGLVDIKVCAIDDTWSGLKLVIRKELRPAGGR